MRIALINTFSPFVRGGAEILVDDLDEQFKEHGHEVQLFRIPFPRTIDSALICTIESARMMCLDEYDRVIAFKFPAYCIKHHTKIIWLFHQFRQVYDLWGQEYGLNPGPLGESIRMLVKTADEEDIPRSRHIYTNSEEVSNRLKKFNKIDSDVLAPPLKHQELYYSDKIGNYIFYPSRITPLKRQHLAVEAMRYVQSGARLIIAGVSEAQYFEQLKIQIRDNSLENRVVLRNEWISDEEKRSLFANSLGVSYIPFNEDSFGFVSMEAFYSAKPVISCTDSGGTRELIENGITGFVTPPDPKAIAAAIDDLYEDKLMAERMGKAGRDEIIRRDITWSNTIKRLLI